MRELFVYYRVRAGHETSAWDTVNAFQVRLRQRFPQINARLMRRPEADGGAQTWMETYAMDAAGNADGITAEIEQEIEAMALALAPCIEGARHAEAFVPVSAGRDAR